MNTLTSVFVRGQVWYWEDPIYGPKANNMVVASGESTIRYSRYCIIAQDSDTLSNNTILVIPCSTKNKTSHDIPIKLTYMSCAENNSYAKVSSVFPVNPKNLTRYICTLGNNVMRLIDAELRKILLPSIEDKLNSDSNEEVVHYADDYVGDSSEDISGIDSDDTDKELKTPSSRKKFTIDDKREFIKNYLSTDIERVAEEYSIKVSTAHSYLYKFKKDLGIQNLNDVLNVEETSINELPVIQDAAKSVSKVTNKILSLMKNEEIFEVTSAVLNTTNETIDGARIDFYDKLESSIYFSITDFLGITVYGSNKFYLPSITIESPNLNTWHFLDKIYHDKKICREEDGIQMVKLYRKYYGDINTGIDREWLELFKQKLIKKFDEMFTDEDYELILSEIETNFCN